jgi:flagellar protein FlbD
MNNQSIVLNSDLIEHIEAVPDTIIALTTEQRLFVRESVEEVVGRIVEFRRQIAVSSEICRCQESPERAHG